MSAASRNCTILVLLCCLRCPAADSDYYHQYLRLTDTNSIRQVTNAVLVDTNNKTAKLKNVVLCLQKMREQGQVGDIHLGMTMDEIVARWGKPSQLNCWCRNRFCYGDCTLYFHGDSLYSVYLEESALFDHGLSARSNLKQWTEVLGQPSLRNDDVYGTSLAFETRGTIRTVLSLTFDPDGEMLDPPKVILDPIISNWFKPSRP
jgi:hypothetical protein